MIDGTAAVANMAQPGFSKSRFKALKFVDDGHVCYNNGLADCILGYAWSHGHARQMSPHEQRVLNELWRAGWIDILTQKIFAPQGHLVTTTPTGKKTIRLWEYYGRALAA